MLRTSLSVESLEAREVPAALIFSDLLVSSYADQKVEPAGITFEFSEVLITNFSTGLSDAAGQPMESR
jgi:hypothetical protein